ncbi:hypothetical protein [Alkalicoccus chagannorensis]|uniref:hypothetical protein n=1 Tax=Alkalicoccus chagannorensis TaxID=427072 RepID=UPI0004170C39|nr:hypothetical protein [Alkalicoccus chagannorensis]
MYAALWKKEWRESLPRFVIILGLLSAGYIGILVLAFRGDPLGVLIGIAAVGLHLVFLFLQWTLAFHGEWKSRTQWTWLNIPAPAWQLVTAKLGVGFVQYLLSVALMTGVGFWALAVYAQTGDPMMAEAFPLFAEGLLALYPLLFTMLTLLSISLGLVAVFILLMMKSWLPLGGWIGTAAAAAAVYSWFQFSGSAVYASLFQNVVLFDAGARLELLLNEEGVETGAGGGLYLYAGELTLEVLVIAAIIALLSWMLDRIVQA